MYLRGSRIPSTTSYVVHTDTITYLLALKSTPNYFAKVLRNTKGSTDELRANPQYVNSVAYDILKAAKYPMSLPFDLFGDEIRAALNKVKLDRWEIMQVFHGTTSPNFATDGQIAAEYFGIAVDTNELLDEMRIIIVPDVANQHEYWGEGSASDMLDKMKNVKAFLTETGIEYNDLLRLLDLKTINPNGDLKIDNLDATCDLTPKEITNLDAGALDRFNRFLRMWRKTEWEMWEIDLLIRAPAVGAGRLDEAFLINAMHFHQLQETMFVSKPASLMPMCITTKTVFGPTIRASSSKISLSKPLLPAMHRMIPVCSSSIFGMSATCLSRQRV